MGRILRLGNGQFDFDDDLTEKFLVYSGANVEYVCEALVPGTLTSATGWRIKKLFYSGDNVVKIRWANSDPSFDKIADNYASYTYPA